MWAGLVVRADFPLSRVSRASCWDGSLRPRAMTTNGAAGVIYDTREAFALRHRRLRFAHSSPVNQGNARKAMIFWPYGLHPALCA